MVRLPSLVFVSGLLYALARGLLCATVPLRVLGVFRLTGAGGAPLPVAPTDDLWAVAAVLIGAMWGLLQATALVVALDGARRGQTRAWVGLGAWWGVAGLELVGRVGVTLAFARQDHAVEGLFTGAAAQDDVCCCLPMSALWLLTLGATLVSAGASAARARRALRETAPPSP